MWPAYGVSAANHTQVGGRPHRPATRARSLADNAIPIKDWFDDRSDEVLLDLLPFLDALSYCDDVRSVLSLRNT